MIFKLNGEYENVYRVWETFQGLIKSYFTGNTGGIPFYIYVIFSIPSQFLDFRHDLYFTFEISNQFYANFMFFLL